MMNTILGIIFLMPQGQCAGNLFMNRKNVTVGIGLHTDQTKHAAHKHAYEPDDGSEDAYEDRYRSERVAMPQNTF